MSGGKNEIPGVEDALPGRESPISISPLHYVLKNPMQEPFEGMALAMFGMGCFWGAEKQFWQADGVFSTQVGYAAGLTPNPTYEEVCSGRTGHNEVVRVAFDPASTSYEAMLKLFWENHNPTQGMRQGNDTGTQYRSGIYTFDAEQRRLAQQSREAYQTQLTAAGFGPISSEIVDSVRFYYAEDYHQQYLAKNPAGYCGLGGTGVSCAVGLVR